MDTTDSFYDELAPYMASPADYCLDDIEEILRSTDSHLDSSIDFTTYAANNVPDFEMPIEDTGQINAQQDGYNFNLSAFPSPATTHQSACTPPHESHRTMSTSSMDGIDQFNPDDFINFLSNDDVKMDESGSDISQNRNTPSPTSSIGSSTSGVQSDASSVSSYPETKYLLQDIDSQVDSAGQISNVIDSMNMPTEAAFTIPPSPVSISSNGITTVSTHSPSPPSIIIPSSTVTSPPKVLPISVPVLPLQTTPTATSATILQPINLLQGTLIPVKTVPLTAVTPLGNIKVPTPVKCTPKFTPKTVVQPVKVIPAANIKVTPPTNTKPKTIFLSSNDFKALVQKMNTNGKSTKITGGIAPQMPKIIMKTANGKVITANKIVQPLNSTSGQHFLPKIVKSNGQLVLKQTAKPSSPAVVAHKTLTSPTNGTGPDYSIYKGLIDEKLLKKQQRMIKNRESASMSRKKKKEYVVSLESRINNLEKENYTLKGENSSLRSQLVAFAQTCQCKHSNVSEFILNSLNVNGKMNGGMSSSCNSETHHIKIAPKPAPKSIRPRMSAANVRKNIAMLFAMAFMVTLNVGNFQNYLNKNTIENSVETAEESVASAGRRLLWVETESEFKEKLIRNKRENELDIPPPPLHFLRPINRTKGIGALAAEQQRNGSANEPPPLTKCQSGYNQTENLRIASNLHKWIDGNDYLNLSLHSKFSKDIENPYGSFEVSPDYYEFDSFDLPLQGPSPAGMPKRRFPIQQSPYINKKPKLEMDANLDNDNGIDDDKHSLELFKPKLSEEYLRLFKGIKRRDDTFYVLSFNMDHILLPASNYNKSSRPKMSLMLPTGDPSLNGDIMLMQIDCEVLNTTELELKSDMIPEKLRPNKYGNVNLHTPTGSDMANNETGGHQRKVYANNTVEKMKEKPPIRTYLMMGPKAQAAAALRKKNDLSQMPESNVLVRNDSNIKNSTLYAKMRQTVAGNIMSP